MRVPVALYPGQWGDGPCVPGVKEDYKEDRLFCYSCAFCLLNPVKFWLIQESGGDEVWTKEAIGLSPQEHLKEVSLWILGHPGKCKKRERCRPVCSPGAPAPHSVPVRLPAFWPGSAEGALSVTHSGNGLISQKSIVVMSFLPSPLPHTANP